MLDHLNEIAMLACMMRLEHSQYDESIEMFSNDHLLKIFFYYLLQQQNHRNRLNFQQKNINILKNLTFHTGY